MLCVEKAQRHLSGHHPVVLPAFEPDIAGSLRHLTLKRS